MSVQEIPLQSELDSLRSKLAEAEGRLAEAQEVIVAIQSGEVDALVVSGADGEQVFTLRGAEAAYRSLVEAMSEGAASISSDGMLLYCNQHLAGLLGIALDQIMGRPISEVVGSNAMATLEPMIQRALQGLPARAEVEMRSAAGCIVPTHISVSKMKIEEPTALCIVVTDLTETKKREDLVAAGRLTRSILDSSAEGIAVCDAHGNIQAVNEVLKRLCGSNPIYKNFDTAFPLTIEVDDREEHFSIKTSLEAPVRAREVCFRRSDGSELSLLLSSGLIPDGEHSAGCVLTFTDITSRKQVEQALVQSEKLAAVGRLASSIAHEINNPLESVTNLLYIAQSASDLAEVRQHLELADRELRRVSAITSQTLRFHKQSTSPTEIRCEELIEGVVSIFQGRILNAGIRVEKRYRCKRPIRCFEGEIRQVLSNLVSNAIDAMLPTGGRLLLRSREAQDHAGREGVMLTVADNGPGMSEKTLEKAFEPFFTTKGFSGTGLGLWISQDIVGRHRGRMRLRSTHREVRGGTLVTLFLPFTASSR